MTEEQLHREIAESVERTQAACDAVLACPWWRPFVLYRMKSLMRKQHAHTKSLANDYTRLFAPEGNWIIWK